MVQTLVLGILSAGVGAHREHVSGCSSELGMEGDQLLGCARVEAQQTLYSSMILQWRSLCLLEVTCYHASKIMKKG